MFGKEIFRRCVEEMNKQQVKVNNPIPIEEQGLTRSERRALKRKRYGRKK